MSQQLKTNTDVEHLNKLRRFRKWCKSCEFAQFFSKVHTTMIIVSALQIWVSESANSIGRLGLTFIFLASHSNYSEQSNSLDQSWTKNFTFRTLWSNLNGVDYPIRKNIKIDFCFFDLPICWKQFSNLFSFISIATFIGMFWWQDMFKKFWQRQTKNPIIKIDTFILIN